MVKVDRQTTNRVITLSSDSVGTLDDWTSQLLDIIDSYGGSNPYPRFFIFSDRKYYSCTTKIPKESAEEFDKEVKEFIER